MTLGSISVTDRAVETHRDSYVLDRITVVSVRRPFFVPGLLFAAGIAGFTIAFVDLLYPGEILGFAGVTLACLIVGRVTGQLQLLSRDLRGSELSMAMLGTYGHLNRIRRQITAAMRDQAEAP
ncbi:MAG: hypothetical protein NXH97_21070 [Rhodobacteraceae bacterium]|nr:hypothetical protein [Paracoccaceae bacterium]